MEGNQPTLNDLSVVASGTFSSRMKSIDWKVEILRWAESTYQRIDMTFPGEEPLEIEWDEARVEDAFQGSRATVRVISTSDRIWTDLYTLDSGMVVMRVYRRPLGSSSWTLHWHGLRRAAGDAPEDENVERVQKHRGERGRLHGHRDRRLSPELPQLGADRQLRHGLRGAAHRARLRQRHGSDADGERQRLPDQHPDAAASGAAPTTPTRPTTTASTPGYGTWTATRTGWRHGAEAQTR